MATKIKLLTILATLLIAAAGVMTFEACNKKDKDSVEPAAQNKNPQDATVSYLDDKGIAIPISWQWHRKKYNCKSGFGICDFVIGKPKPIPELSSSNDSTHYTYIQFDSRNSCDMEIVLCGTERFDDTIKNLYVDEDIIVTGPDGYIYRINEGIYPFNGVISTHGGYNVNISRSLDNE